MIADQRVLEPVHQPLSHGRRLHVQRGIQHRDVEHLTEPGPLLEQRRRDGIGGCHSAEQIHGKYPVRVGPVSGCPFVDIILVPLNGPS